MCFFVMNQNCLPNIMMMNRHISYLRFSVQFKRRTSLLTASSQVQWLVCCWWQISFNFKNDKQIKVIFSYIFQSVRFFLNFIYLNFTIINWCTLHVWTGIILAFTISVARQIIYTHVWRLWLLHWLAWIMAVSICTVTNNNISVKKPK